MTFIITLVLGVPLLIWGRKLFWLFVGAVGFLTGFWLAQRFLPAQEEWVTLIMAAALGIIGILLALMVQKFAITVTGFLAGIYMTISVINSIGFDSGPWNWFIFVSGGIVGSILVFSMFDWALIILSSLVGAAMISQASFEMVQFALMPRTLIFVVLLVIGLIVQFEQKQRET